MPETTMGWRCRFFGGMVDGCDLVVPDCTPTPLAFVYPCPAGCKKKHRQFRAHLRFENEVRGVDLPMNTVVYRREELDASLMIAVYRLGEGSPERANVEQETVIAELAS